MSDPTAEQIYSCFGRTASLYDILGVSVDATTQEIKQGYRKQALIHHPDKGGDAEKFKALCYVHTILSNEDSRKQYDQTGEIDGNADEEGFSQDFEELYKYFRALFPKITTTAIDEFSEKYKNSEEERGDILKAYSEKKGNVKHILDNVMLLEAGEEGRICAIIDAAIASGEVTSYPKYEKFALGVANRGAYQQQPSGSGVARCAGGVTGSSSADEPGTSSNPPAHSTKPSTKGKRAQASAVSAADPTGASSPKVSGPKKASGLTPSLEEMILSRNKSNGDFYDKLLEKYSEPASKKQKGGTSSGRGARSAAAGYEDIPDDVFEQARERVLGGGGKKESKKGTSSKKGSK